MKNLKLNRKKILCFVSILLIACLVGIIAIMHQLKTAHAYEISYDTSSKTYSKGYFDVVINGPNGKERMNLEINYSGSQMTQSKFIKSSRSVTLNRKSGEQAGIYSGSLVTTSTKTLQDDNGDYTKIQFQIKYKQPAHQEADGCSRELLTDISNDYLAADFIDYYDKLNTGGQLTHRSSAHNVTLTVEASIYGCGVCNYKSGNEYKRMWNSEIELSLAKYQNVVNYHGNGGKFLDSSGKEVTDDWFNEYLCGVKIQLRKTKDRTGYTFTGWNDKSDGSGNSYTANSTLCGQQINLYAQWKANEYKLHYDANGGTGSMTDSTVTYDNSFTLPQNTFKKSGYEFLGWSKTKDGTVAYQDEGKFTYKTASDTTLYAVWGEGQYNVSFQPNGADADSKTVTLKCSQQETLQKNTYTRKGYTFVGWNSNPYAASAEYSDEQKVTDLAASGKTKKLYAVWKKTDGSFNTTNIIHDENMFTGDINIEGEAGTGYDTGHTDSEYARIDKSDKPGYFTKR